MPVWLQAVVLGIVQGLTEFIPVSSSGHLVVVPYLAGWQSPGLAFDVALHLGTAGAVVVFFRRELAALARGVLSRGGGPDAALARRLALLIVAASVPVAVVGLLAEDLVTQAFRSPLAVAAFFLVTAVVLTLGERRRDRRVAAATRPAAPDGADVPVWTGDWIGTTATVTAAPASLSLPVGDDPGDPAGETLDGIGLRQALLVGAAQIVALLPGVSRSGMTIAAGVAAGLTREAAARFSFLLSLPALLGAFVLSLPDLGEPGPYSGAAVAAAVVAAFVSGYAAIRFLVRLLSRERLTGFARYCVFAAAVTAVGYAFLGPPSSV